MYKIMCKMDLNKVDVIPEPVKICKEELVDGTIKNEEMLQESLPKETNCSVITTEAVKKDFIVSDTQIFIIGDDNSLQISQQIKEKEENDKKQNDQSIQSIYHGSGSAFYQSFNDSFKVGSHICCQNNFSDTNNFQIKSLLDEMVSWCADACNWKSSLSVPENDSPHSCVSPFKNALNNKSEIFMESLHRTSTFKASHWNPIIDLGVVLNKDYMIEKAKYLQRQKSIKNSIDDSQSLMHLKTTSTSAMKKVCKMPLMKVSSMKDVACCSYNSKRDSKRLIKSIKAKDKTAKVFHPHSISKQSLLKAVNSLNIEDSSFNLTKQSKIFCIFYYKV